MWWIQGQWDRHFTESFSFPRPLGQASALFDLLLIALMMEAISISET
jgi:hypothetical protein